MEPFHPNLQDKPSLQRGLRLYVNYCMGCHSLKFQRYERTADDLEIPHDLVMANLVFTGQKIGALMTNALPPERAKAWFGAAPPDLTLVAKLRGGEWVYNYLKAFYIDEARPFGVNNKVFPNVAMPRSVPGVARNAGTDVPPGSEDGRERGEQRDPLVPGLKITEEKCGYIDVGRRYRYVDRERVRSGRIRHRQLPLLRGRACTKRTRAPRPLRFTVPGGALCVHGVVGPRVQQGSPLTIGSVRSDCAIPAINGRTFRGPFQQTVNEALQ